MTRSDPHSVASGLEETLIRLGKRDSVDGILVLILADLLDDDARCPTIDGALEAWSVMLEILTDMGVR